DDAHVAATLDVGHELQRVLDDVSDEVRVMAAAFIGDEFFDAPAQFGVHRRPIRLFHGASVTGGEENATAWQPGPETIHVSDQSDQSDQSDTQGPFSSTDRRRMLLSHCMSIPAPSA